MRPWCYSQGKALREARGRGITIQPFGEFEMAMKEKGTKPGEM